MTIPRTEADLVRACASGDAAAWETFVDRCGPLLSALARRMLERRTGRSPGADVDEVVSAVFLALVRDDRRLLARYDPRWRLSTYLGVIVRTEVGRWLRRRSPAPRGRAASDAALEEVPDPRAQDPAALVLRHEREEALRRLLRALDLLAPRDRLLLSLRYLEDLDYGRIAQVLRVGRDSVGQLLHRAKERLAAAVPDLEGIVRDGRFLP